MSLGWSSRHDTWEDVLTINARYGAKPEDFAEIARVNHEHSTRNPYSQFQDVYSREQIMKAPEIFAPLTKLQCCPTSDGGAAAVLVSQAFLDERPHLKDQAVLVAGQCLATDAPSLFSRSPIEPNFCDIVEEEDDVWHEREHSFGMSVIRLTPPALFPIPIQPRRPIFPIPFLLFTLVAAALPS